MGRMHKVARHALPNGCTISAVQANPTTLPVDGVVGSAASALPSGFPGIHLGVWGPRLRGGCPVAVRTACTFLMEHGSPAEVCLST